MVTLADLSIAPHVSLKEAMQRMTGNRKGILLVCDENRHLMGVLSDGDVRRSLLAHTLLVSPISKVMNTDPVTAETTQEGMDLLDRVGAVAVPIVGADGQLKEVLVKDGKEVRVLQFEERKEECTERKTGVGNAIAIIPARRESRRIPRKNLARVAGKPLVAWAILAAKAARHVGHVIVSTDDPEVAQVGRSLGIEVPWLRPEALAKDDTPTVEVVWHALHWATEHMSPVPEFAALLEPTAPLRRSGHIDRAMDMLKESDADSVVSVCQVPHVLNPEEMVVIRDGLLRPYLPDRTMDSRRLRGQQPPAYVQNGLVYAFRIEMLLNRRSLYGQKCLPLVMDWEDFLDIDDSKDLGTADFKMSQGFENDSLE